MVILLCLKWFADHNHKTILHTGIESVVLNALKKKDKKYGESKNLGQQDKKYGYW